MKKLLFASAAVLFGLAVAGCRGGTSGQPGSTAVLPSIDRDIVIYAAMPAAMPKDTIGEELPGQGLGMVKSVKWASGLGGFTQQKYSQSLGFSPGMKLTIKNLSTTTTHTIDVVKEISGPPADFPKGAKLSVDARGGSNFETGYASGPIKPGKSVTVTLAKAGIYLIGCAFHYTVGMHDVIVVEKNAAPGPQATAPPKGGSTGSGSSGSGW